MEIGGIRVVLKEGGKSGRFGGRAIDMISVDEALDHVFALVAPLTAEDVPLRQAAGRVLAAAGRGAPRPSRPSRPRPWTAMRCAGAARRPGARFRVIGEAGGRPALRPGRVGAGEAVRIFTGAPVPEGADRVVIQEDVDARGRHDHAGRPTLTRAAISAPAAADFAAGDGLIAPGGCGRRDLALLAAMNMRPGAGRRAARSSR